jgi:hypothetical protein
LGYKKLTYKTRIEEREQKRKTPVESKAHLPSHWTLPPSFPLSGTLFKERNIPNSRGSYKFSAPILQFEKKKKKKHKQSPKPMCRLLPNSNVCKKAKKHVNHIYTCNFSTPATTMTRRKRSTSEARNNQSSPNLNV